MKIERNLMIFPVIALTALCLSSCLTKVPEFRGSGDREYTYTVPRAIQGDWPTASLT